MGRNRFVRPSTVRLSLSDGDWIEVTRRLNTGEALALYEATNRQIDDRTELNLAEAAGRARLVAYIVEWSLTQTKDGVEQMVPVSRDAINALDPDFFNEMLTALDAHIAAERAGREQEKNAQATATAS